MVIQATRQAEGKLSDRMDFGRALQQFMVDKSTIEQELCSIGEGGFSDVFSGNLKSDSGIRKVVVKYPRGSSDDALKLQRKLVRELYVWSLLDHTNICRFYGLASMPAYPTPGLVSMFVEHDLMDYTADHPEKRLELIQQVATGLHYLHVHHRITHGDLKPDNIRVSEGGVAKIIDFGLGKIKSITGFTTKIGTLNPRFAAPELLDHDETRQAFESDIFAFGMSMLQILHGRDIRRQQRREYDNSRPYNQFCSTPLAEQFAIQDYLLKGGRPLLERYRNITAEQKEFLTLCWKQCPEDRPNIGAVIERLNCMCSV